jgi:hypothetical protein
MTIIHSDARMLKIDSQSFYTIENKNTKTSFQFITLLLLLYIYSSMIITYFKHEHLIYFNVKFHSYLSLLNKVITGGPTYTVCPGRSELGGFTT